MVEWIVSDTVMKHDADESPPAEIYQICTRTESGRYILSPGLTPNAS
jgi:hypothetical protein